MLSGAMTACKSKKKAAAVAALPSGETEIKVLCSGPEFFTDNKVFRANALGESMDQATAKKKALANARAQMASDINTQIKGVIDNYVNARKSHHLVSIRLATTTAGMVSSPRKDHGVRRNATTQG